MIHPFGRVLLSCAVLACAVPPAAAQVAPSGGLTIVHSPMNDLIMQVNKDAETAFATPEGRQTRQADLREELSRLVAIQEAQLKMPADQAFLQVFQDESNFKQALGTDPARMASLKTDAFAAQFRHDLERQIKHWNFVRLALGEPTALKACDDATAQGGEAATQASVDRAAAAWLNAYQNPQAQSAALDSLRAAIKAGGPHDPNQWFDLWTWNPPANADIGTQMATFLQPYSSDFQFRRLLMYMQIKNRHMQLDGKPLVIQGTLVSGAPFTSAGWKGKVILVAGWYAPHAVTVDNFAQIQELLALHHADGLEVLGIACAPTMDSARTFLAQHKNFTAPQLYDHAVDSQDFGCVLTGETRFGTDAQGAPMVIDRKGILHYISDPMNVAAVEAQVGNLLAEKP